MSTSTSSGSRFPEPEGDSGRHHLKASNVDRVVATFAAAGARGVVVSGVVDPHQDVDRGRLPHATVMFCRLRASQDELRRRLSQRGAGLLEVSAALAGAVAMDKGGSPKECVDTTGLEVSQTADLVARYIGDWPPLVNTGRRGATVKFGSQWAVPRVPVLLVCGPTAVGKSVVGWQLYERARRAGLHAAFVDLGQLGFLQPVRADDPNNHRVKAGNLAALWGTFGAARAQCLVLVGNVADRDSAELYRRALRGAKVVLCRLHASPAQLYERVILRGQGQNWREPGDPLKGQSAACLSEVASKAAQEAEDLVRNGLGDICIGTEGRSVEEVVEVVVAETNGWPGYAAKNGGPPT